MVKKDQWGKNNVFLLKISNLIHYKYNIHHLNISKKSILLSFKLLMVKNIKNNK